MGRVVLATVQTDHPAALLLSTNRRWEGMFRGVGLPVPELTGQQVRNEILVRSKEELIREAQHLGGPR